MSEYTGWLAALLMIVGMVLLGYRWRSAFLLSVVGNSIYARESFNLGRWDMVLLSVVFAVLSAVNWYRWGKKDAAGRSR